MHPRVAQAIQEIDAAVCNGDAFDEPEARAELLGYLERWSRDLAVHVPASEPVVVPCFAPAPSIPPATRELLADLLGHLVDDPTGGHDHWCNAIRDVLGVD